MITVPPSAAARRSVLCSTALLRRGLISADFADGDITALDRITTEYIDTVDVTVPLSGVSGWPFPSHRAMSA